MLPAQAVRRNTEQKDRTLSDVGEEVKEHHLTYMEELWPQYTPLKPDVLMHVYGHELLFSVKPGKSVIEVKWILGPASIFRNLGMTSIPKDSHKKPKEGRPIYAKNISERRVWPFSTEHHVNM
jgi:hypothetical protein